MRMVKIVSLCVISVFAAIHATSARADQYTDDLAKCLVSSTTEAQQTLLIKWLFATIALHPSVAPLASVTPSERDVLDQKTAGLFTKLLTVTCKKQASEAVLFDGQAALQTAFGVLGRSAMMGLMNNPKVASGMSALDKYIDKQKIRQALDTHAPTPASSSAGH